ncbi:MAG: hypothetical protein AAF658_05840 [Myxococcota bacterium]
MRRGLRALGRGGRDGSKNTRRSSLVDVLLFTAAAVAAAVFVANRCTG